MNVRKTLAQQVLDRITDHGGDLNSAYPNPFRFQNHKLGRRQAFFDRELAHLLTERDPSRPWGWDADGAYFVRPNSKAIVAYVDGRLDIVPHNWRSGNGRPQKELSGVTDR
jgi:hypothetical protein